MGGLGKSWVLRAVLTWDFGIRGKIDFPLCEICAVKDKSPSGGVSTKVSYCPAAALRLVAHRVGDTRTEVTLTSLRVDSNASRRAFTK